MTCGLVAGMPDAEPQPPEVRAEMRDRVAQAVVAARAAGKLEAHVADRQVELVMHHQHFAGRHLEVVDERADRQPAAIHVRHRLEQRHLAARQLDAADLALELVVTAKARAELRRERVHEPEAGVVTREQVLGSRVAETDDDFERSAGHCECERGQCETGPRRPQ